MSRIKDIQRQTGYSQGKERAPEDFYVTPAWAVEELLKRETFQGEVWECASGNGAIAKVFESHGFTVKSSDLRQDDDVYGEKGVDFLLTGIGTDNVVTNPPFKLALPFVLKALSCSRHKVAMFVRLQFLEGKTRYVQLFSKNPPSRVWVFSERVACIDEKNKTTNAPCGIMCFAWFVWDKQNPTIPELKWITPRERGG